MEGETPSKLLRKLPKFTATVMEGIVRTDSGRWGGRAGRNRERQRVRLSLENEEQMLWEGWSSSGVELLQVIHLRFSHKFFEVWASSLCQLSTQWRSS